MFAERLHEGAFQVCVQCAAVCCSVLQCAAVCCSVLQYAAVCCRVLQCVVASCTYVIQTYARMKFNSWLQEWRICGRLGERKLHDTLSRVTFCLLLILRCPHTRTNTHAYTHTHIHTHIHTHTQYPVNVDVLSVEIARQVTC